MRTIQDKIEQAIETRVAGCGLELCCMRHEKKEPDDGVLVDFWAQPADGFETRLRFVLSMSKRTWSINFYHPEEMQFVIDQYRTKEDIEQILDYIEEQLK